MKTLKENTSLKYYPISTWNSIGDIVKFAFTYSTEEEAYDEATSAQDRFKDSTFQDEVIEVRTSDMGKVWKQAEKKLEEIRAGY